MPLIETEWTTSKEISHLLTKWEGDVNWGAGGKLQIKNVSQNEYSLIWPMKERRKIGAKIIDREKEREKK